MTIKLGQKYTTQKTGVTGRIIRMDLNPTGTTRILLLTNNLKLRWTTYVPERIGQIKR